MPKPLMKVLLPHQKDDWDKFEKLCEIHCTASEIAGIYRISVDTLERRIAKKYKEGFTAVFERFSANGKAALRRAMWQSALSKGNVSAQIFLAKNILGMRDKSDVEIDAIKTSATALKEHTAENILSLVNRVRAASGKDA